MGHYRYNEKWREHNRSAEWSGDAEPSRDHVLPEWFDTSMFESDQLAYLEEYDRERRGELLRGLLEFMTADRDHWVERVCVLDKLINRREIAWREAPSFYGVSNHRFFEAKATLERVFQHSGGHVLNLLKVRECRTANREPGDIEGQMIFDL